MLNGSAQDIVTRLANSIARQDEDCCTVDDFAVEFETTPGRPKSTLKRLEEAGLISIVGEETQPRHTHCETSLQSGQALITSPGRKAHPAIQKGALRLAEVWIRTRPTVSNFATRRVRGYITMLALLNIYRGFAANDQNKLGATYALGAARQIERRCDVIQHYRHHS